MVFEADDRSVGCPIPITDDEVNEAEEFFAVLLEVVDAVSPERVDISGRNVSLCFIVDNDRKSMTGRFGGGRGGGGGGGGGLALCGCNHMTCYTYYYTS